MKIEILKKLKLPDNPGVYFFLKNNKILYIGKATSLRDRTKSYFSKDLINTRGPLILDMAFKSDNVKWEATDSVLEAIILEANLIKKHQPYYNTKEKDDKSFNYVCITKEEFPKILVIRGRNLIKKNFTKTYGPFTNGSQLKEAMKIIRHIFPYLDAKSAQPDHLEFYQQIGLAPDIGTTEAKIAYDKNIKNLKLFFEGKKKKVVSNFKKEMMLYAKNKEFEQANKTKRRIFSLQHINDIALLKLEPSAYSLKPVFRIEAYDIAHMGGKNMVGSMVVVEDGEVVKSEYKKFKIRTQDNANDIGALKEVLERRLAHKEWMFPDLIVVDGGMAQINVTKNVLKKMGINITTVSVLKDERHKPKAIMGDKEFGLKYKREILLANNEAHRFAINYHKNMRNKNFLHKK
ncbi:MAG: GIY-YIG nuclease family protein [Candidatus Paceibacterota bacterium]|jgi:excinuclease ABC subunit C